MGGEWRHSTWGEEISLEYGKRLSGYTEGNGSVRVFGTNGPVGWTDEPISQGPGVVVGRKGAYRGVNYSPDDFYVIDTAYYVRPKSDLYMRWLYYAMLHHEITQLNDGSPIPSTTRSAVYVRELDVPPPIEQSRIADILGTLDDKIELNRQINSTLEAMARAIFKAWFVDFGPVKAKVAGATSFRGMPQAVFDRLPDTFADTEMGSVPEGWEVKPLGSIATMSRDSITPADSPDEIFEHFSIPAFDAGMRPASDLGSSIKSNKYAVSPHCVLVSKLNPRFARVWLPDEPTNGARQICSTEFLVITPTEGWSREQLFCQFVDAGFRQTLERRATGTSNSHQRIKPKDFERTSVVAPPVNVRQAFVDCVGALFAKSASNQRESLTLVAIRDSLLPKLISGELRVEPRECSFAEVACR